MPPAEDHDQPEPADLKIRAADRHVYDVTITHRSGATTEHVVSVPEALMADLGVSVAQEPLLVRATLAYLLEHDPAAVPERFSLDEVGAAIPEFRDEIVGRL
jgi:hypothetical protein